ncbi:MAG: Hsp20/alpha crystallin family protein [Thermoproteus sp.]|jgi:HSP20 family protein|uniref:Hsp20/alpha crystallin family protein n=1 Tax=Thermoproteus sp. CP80 TaxID=1650659 RepID=UPI000747B378|nr:Hsp20/alpha crystallin family protein [Thermoproteus sp. CP80]KUO84293.1 MAG: heat-shock protein Hsp20 [Thermoproteus sp. CIS_19]KUO86950.1 MAG: heat-shock protein Hsp20 [Thermoproteus sp. JCHS_4]MCI4464607.1 Hsp20/alpha crystallin family protein [Thermoproteus sp.]MDT7869407.1 Hsp20/alpha crystallin family protein [Thermoproteus sp.]MDT7881286.1 Hsp20/alpha crystallin family protein [Thermoproteus sp.]
MEPIKKIEEGLKELYTANVGKIEREPDVDIYEQGENLLIMVDLPGFRKDSIKVKLFEHAVEITALPNSDVPGRAVIRERAANFPIQRRIELPFRLRVDSARAIYKDGVLQISAIKAGEVGTAELKID